MTRIAKAPTIDFTAVRKELRLPGDFPAPAAAEAAQPPAGLPREDLTAVPFVTIDPATSRDLDQAMHLSKRGTGYRVRYAIADVAAFVTPGGALDTETWARGLTVYLPGEKIPLHPPVLSEGQASLLPDETRPAVVWTIDVDADGATNAVTVGRALIRSRAKLDYAISVAKLPEPIALLPALGRILVARGLARGAVNLPIPEQEAERDGDGWRLALRRQTPMEEYNAQISLLTGAAAGTMMLDGGVGLLRTMPPPAPEAVQRLHTCAQALGVPWPDGATIGEVVASTPPDDPRGAAFLDAAAELMRGAGYTAFDGTPPEQPLHSAMGLPYAHVTAPIRRLADRYATEVCLALHAGQEIPAWAREALPRLPEVMRDTDRRASAAERAAIDLVEAVLLAGRVGEKFEAAVLDLDGRGRDGGLIAVDELGVIARCEGRLPLGERITVVLAEADPATRKVLFKAA
ncbi:RNB domain-containing ribonuclease [Longispora albida]|uniref:RNB domain-containing ribonuclease n=1 Tax=Longispora albida TaxID=203523 RepID=UPI00036730F6|nr:RNB domain-containing ribonuclease [Longispora albida]